MSRRIVVLGRHDTTKHRVKALEIGVGDAAVLLGVAPDLWRVSLTLWDGVLADATVIRWARPDEEVSSSTWEALKGICHGSQEFEIEAPMPTRSGGLL